MRPGLEDDWLSVNQRWSQWLVARTPWKTRRPCQAQIRMSHCEPESLACLDARGKPSKRQVSDDAENISPDWADFPWAWKIREARSFQDILRVTNDFWATSSSGLLHHRSTKQRQFRSTCSADVGRRLGRWRQRWFSQQGITIWLLLLHKFVLVFIHCICTVFCLYLCMTHFPQLLLLYHAMLLYGSVPWTPSSWIWHRMSRCLSWLVRVIVIPPYHGSCQSPVCRGN